MRIDIVSVLPGIFEEPLSASMLGIARERGALDLRVHDLRQWALPGVHRQVDDAPYGGGPGMVMRPEPFFDAVSALRSEGPQPLVALLTPQGRAFDQPLAEDLASRERIVLLCGRYEGVDERVRSLADLEISVGDYVLTGGELPAMIVVDAVARLLPGVLGHENSTTEESFSWGLLEYPHYTRPAEYAGAAVPDILRSGDHGRIRAWRRLEAIRRTALLRPDMLAAADLTPDEREYADRVLEEGANGADMEDR